MPRAVDGPSVFRYLRQPMVLLIAAWMGPLLLGQVEPSPELEGARIVAIRVEGTERVEPESVRNALGQRAGQPFRPAQTADDLRRLFALGQFADVQLSVERVPEGVVYVVRVEELPLLREVRFVGADRFRREDLLEAAGLEAGEPIGPGDLARAVRGVAARYEERGYAFTRVGYRLEPAPDRRADVIIEVDERPRVLIGEIRIEGVGEELARALEAALPFDEANLLTRVTGSGFFTEGRLRRAEEVILEQLADRGFLQARVVGNVAFGPERRTATVTFLVEPGPQFRIGSLRLEGELVPSREQLMSLVSLREGDVLSRAALQRDIQALTRFLYELGRACAAVTPVFDPDPTTGKADVTLRVSPGPAVVFGRAEIAGNALTRDYVIERELAFEPGQPFSASALEQSVDRLRKLGLFRAVAIEPGRCAEGRVPVVVRVEEADHFTYSASIGFASAENVVGTVRVAEHNLFGTGRSLSAFGQASSLRYSIEAAWREPYLLGTDLDLTLTGGRHRIAFPSFERTATGGAFSLRHSLERAGIGPLTATFGCALNVVSVEASPELASLPELAPALAGGRISLLSVSLSFDRQDDALMPRRGALLSGSAEVSPALLGATVRFARFSGLARMTLPLPKDVRARLRGSLTLVQPLDGPTPISERLFVGGFGTVRGYRFRSIAPELDVPTEGGPAKVLVGGNKRVLFGAEIELPLLLRYGLYAVLFWDAGNVFAEDEPLFVDRRDDVPLAMFHSVGPGLRWFTPVGPVRLELAFPLNLRPQDSPVVVEVGLGLLP